MLPAPENLEKLRAIHAELGGGDRKPKGETKETGNAQQQPKQVSRPLQENAALADNPTQHHAPMNDFHAPLLDPNAESPHRSRVLCFSESQDGRPAVQRVIVWQV